MNSEEGRTGRLDSEGDDGLRVAIHGPSIIHSPSSFRSESLLPFRDTNICSLG